MTSWWPWMLCNPPTTQEDEWLVRPSPTHLPRRWSQDNFLPPPRFWWCLEASLQVISAGYKTPELQCRIGLFVTGYPTTPITAMQPLLFWNHFWCVGQEPRVWLLFLLWSTYIMNRLYLYWPNQNLGAAETLFCWPWNSKYHQFYICKENNSGNNYLSLVRSFKWDPSPGNTLISGLWDPVQRAHLSSNQTPGFMENVRW